MWPFKSKPRKPKYRRIGSSKSPENIPDWVYRRFKQSWRAGDPDQHKYNHGHHLPYGPGTILYFNGKKFRYKFIIQEGGQWLAYRRHRNQA